jgi:hypothetical protein
MLSAADPRSITGHPSVFATNGLNHYTYTYTLTSISSFSPIQPEPIPSATQSIPNPTQPHHARLHPQTSTACRHSPTRVDPLPDESVAFQLDKHSYQPAAQADVACGNLQYFSNCCCTNNNLRNPCSSSLARGLGS